MRIRETALRRCEPPVRAGLDDRRDELPRVVCLRRVRRQPDHAEHGRRHEDRLQLRRAQASAQPRSLSGQHAAVRKPLRLCHAKRQSEHGARRILQLPSRLGRRKRRHHRRLPVRVRQGRQHHGHQGRGRRRADPAGALRVRRGAGPAQDGHSLRERRRSRQMDLFL